MQDDKEKQEERRIWLSSLMQYVKPGRIVEFGCGSGFVLEILAEKFKDSFIVGIDNNIERLEKVSRKELRNVIPIYADITQDIFVNNTFNTAFFVASLHEVFSFSGKEKVKTAFENAYKALKDDGILIVHDFLRPDPRLIEIGFKNETTKKIFHRFAKEFRPRNVEFEETARGAKLDIGDAVEFISKYRSPSEDDWLEEMGEAHFFFTMEDYKQTALRTGFHIRYSNRVSRSEKRWIDVRDDIEFEFEPEYSFIQLVLEKL